MTDPKWYIYLTDAQLYWMTQLATHCPSSQYGASEKLTSSDSNYSYDFPNNVTPIGHVELRKSPTGALMIPGAEWDHGADFVVQQNKIRFPGSKAKAFTDGPYARYVAVPGDLDADNEPVGAPEGVRILYCYRAVAMWARRGGLRDPRPFEEEEARLAWGDPQLAGDLGMIGALKQQYAFQGSEAFGQNARWYDGINDGSGYNPQV